MESNWSETSKETVFIMKLNDFVFCIQHLDNFKFSIEKHSHLQSYACHFTFFRFFSEESSRIFTSSWPSHQTFSNNYLESTMSAFRLFICLYVGYTNVPMSAWDMKQLLQNRYYFPKCSDQSSMCLYYILLIGQKNTVRPHQGHWCF